MEQKKYDHLLLDAKNALYRAIYANRPRKTGDRPSTVHPLTAFFRFLSKYMQKFKPKHVHFFWDAPKKTVWRRKIYKEYKDNRSHDKDVDRLVIELSEILQEMTPHLNVRSYEYERQEADDLIYAFCRQFRTSQLVIVSSDGDFKQIAYLFDNVGVYVPFGKKEGLIKVPDVDPVTVKCLWGEKGDNIDGYQKIGEVNATKIATDPKRRADFFSKNDGTLYRRNRVLIDLTLCPFLLQNLFYVDEVVVQPTKFDMKALYEIIQRYKVKGLAGEISQLLLPFKHLGSDKEK